MKHVFIFIHLMFLTLLAYQGATIMYKNLAFPSLQGETILPDSPVPLSVQAKNGVVIPHEQLYKKIITRNLFNVLIDKPAEESTLLLAPKPEKILEKTQLKLVLWGTVTGGTSTASFAVIEDKKERKQSLFTEGDVIQGASVKQILRNKVILSINGKDQILETEVSQLAAQEKTGTVQKDIVSPQQKLQEPVESLPMGPLDIDMASLMEEFKTRPYLKNGEPSGLLLYGIRPGSAFLRLGLKNGDILLKLNQTQTLTQEDTQKIFQELEKSSDMQFVVLRRGQENEIVYNAETTSHTVQAVTNE